MFWICLGYTDFSCGICIIIIFSLHCICRFWLTMRTSSKNSTRKSDCINRGYWILYYLSFAICVCIMMPSVCIYPWQQPVAIPVCVDGCCCLWLPTEIKCLWWFLETCLVIISFSCLLFSAFFLPLCAISGQKLCRSRNPSIKRTVPRANETISHAKLLTLNPP